MILNMKELLTIADQYHFAVPAFNISSYAMFNGIMDISEALDAPVIAEIHPLELRHIGSDVVAAMKQRAAVSKVPVVIHMDHGACFEDIMTAIAAGFTSVMIDASSLPFEENVAACKKTVEAAHGAIHCIMAEKFGGETLEGGEVTTGREYVPAFHASNVSVEGELGNIGSIDEVNGTVTEGMHFTEPEEAVRFVKATGIDTLAIAIGTSHGVYPEGFVPHLQIDRLKAIHKALREAGLDTALVLHGGSGNPPEELMEAARNGVGKINISSDIKNAYYGKMREVLQDKKVREPNIIEPSCIAAMKEAAADRIRWFGADGKAGLYR